MQVPQNYAAIAAFYTDPLPFERSGNGYARTIAIARLHALRSVLGEDQIVRYHGRVTEPVPRKAAKPRKSMTAEQFFDAYQTARRTVSERHGLRWVIEGLATWATVPAGWRSFKGPRGGKVTLPKDIRVPPADCWPLGMVPVELIMAPPPPANGTPWVIGYGPDGKSVLMHPMLANLQAAREEALLEAQARTPMAETEPVEEIDATDYAA